MVSSIYRVLDGVSRQWSLRQIRGYRYASSSTATLGHAADEWETVIGLEVHAQIRTDKKLFSGTFYRLP